MLPSSPFPDVLSSYYRLWFLVAVDSDRRLHRQQLAVDRDRGTPRGATPPPPPGIRLTYHGGSTGLSLNRDMEPGETKRVEVAVWQGLLNRRVS